MPNALERLKQFLDSQHQPAAIESLTADASTREYFRVKWNGDSAVACVYPEPFEPAVGSYVDVTELFLAADLPVAAILAFDALEGIIIQEDLGDRVLRDYLTSVGKDERERRIDESIGLIARVQAATGLTFERNSIASQLRFDKEKLLWELDYFKQHYFGTFRNSSLPPADNAALTREFVALAEELEALAQVLCHRDFHAANLMIDQHAQLRIIDHQDARIGAAAYDLVSLLLDRVTEVPDDDWLASKRRLLMDERAKIGLPDVNESDLEYEFTLQAIQRCLKAAGTFSYQSAVRGKTYFVPFIDPMVRIATAAAARLDRFPAIRKILGRELS